MSYDKLIQGYQSPEQSGQQDLLIDFCNPAPTPPPCPTIHTVQYRPQDDDMKSRRSQFSTRSSRRDCFSNSGKKSYTFLSQFEMDEFQADLKRGELTKEQLCDKYQVSISTTARFIRNLKEFGQLNVKKSKQATNELMNKLIVEYPHLTFAQIKKKIAEQAHQMSSQRQYQLAATNKYK